MKVFIKGNIILFLVLFSYNVCALLKEQRIKTNRKSKASKCINEQTEKLRDYLRKEKYLVSDAVEKVFCQVDRGDFAPKKDAYEIDPAYIGAGATISRPRAHIRALEAVFQKFPDTKAKIKILDVGSGSGYLSVAFNLLYPNSMVYGIEHIDKLVKDSIANVKKVPNFAKLLDKSVFLVVGDGLKGMENEQPFDYIHSGASSESVPEPLFNQLKPGGRLCIPLGKGMDQYITFVDKTEDGKKESKKDINEPYVTLQDKDKQLEQGKANMFVKP